MTQSSNGNLSKMKTDKTTTMRFEQEHSASAATGNLGQEITTSEDTEEEIGSNPMSSLNISEVPV